MTNQVKTTNQWSEYIATLEEKGVNVTEIQQVHPQRLAHSWYGGDVLRIQFNEKSGYPTFECVTDRQDNTKPQTIKQKIKTAIIHANGDQLFVTHDPVNGQYNKQEYTDRHNLGIMTRAITNMGDTDKPYALTDSMLNELIANGYDGAMDNTDTNTLLPAIEIESDNAWYVRYYDEQGKFIEDELGMDANESLLEILKDVTRDITTK